MVGTRRICALLFEARGRGARRTTFRPDGRTGSGCNAEPHIRYVEGAPGASFVASLAASHGAYRLVYGSGRSGVGADDIAAALGGEDLETVLSATAHRLDKGSWGSDFL